MAGNRILLRIKTYFLIIILLLVGTGGTYAQAKTGKGDAAIVINEAQLQGQVMAFADRYWSIIGSAFLEYSSRSPSPENLRLVRTLMVFSGADAFTIAAGPNPAAAFLDMVVMVTLGRMVFEQHYSKLHGDEIAPLIEGFKKTEADIWEIGDTVLTKEKQAKLMGLIKAWRRENPEVVVFSRVRFNEFEKFRRLSGAEGEESGGFFNSVTKATEQVEEAKLLAERGMYLFSRLPLMTGSFANAWVSSLAKVPEVSDVLSDLQRAIAVSERMAIVAEKLPDDIAKERQATIDQLVDRVSEERENTITHIFQEIDKERRRIVDRVSEELDNTITHIFQHIDKERRRTIDDFLAEEQRLGGLLTELKLTLNSGNELLVSANNLVDHLNIDAPKESATAPSKPFDIKDYQATLQEASNTILQMHNLLNTVDQMELSKALPVIIEAIDKMEQKGRKWVLQAFILGIFLVFILLTGAVFAMLLYRRLTQRMFTTENQPAPF